MALDFFEELTRLVIELESASQPYAVAGAVALAIHGAPRATADIDLLVPVEAVAGVLEVARRCGFTIDAAPMRFSDGTEVRRVSKLVEEEALTLDLLLVNPNLESVWQSRERVETEGGPVWVLSRDGLIRMKALAGREQDWADIRRLEELDR